MRNYLHSALAGLCSLYIVLACNSAVAVINRPDCAALQHWAESRTPNSLFEPRPGFKVNTLFEDAKVVPLFGSPLPSWDLDDLSILQRFLFQCRKQAMANDDRSAGNALYEATTESQQASKMLNAVCSARRLAEDQVKYLLELKPSSEFTKILAIAEISLKGGDASARVGELPTQWQSDARLAVKLADYRKLLSIEDIASLLAKLEARRNEMTEKAVEDAGYGEQNSPSPMKPTTAAQQKGPEASTALAQVLMLLNTVLEGSNAEDASIFGFRPGAILGVRPDVSYPESKNVAESVRNNIEGNPLGDVDEQLFARSSDFKRLLQSDGRNGGWLTLSTQSGVVGGVTFLEHFSFAIEVMPLREALSARFGRPDQERKHNDDSVELFWQDGKRYLLIQAGNNIVNPARQSTALRSAMQISLWTQDFADYLMAAAQRCEKLRHKPVAELSVNDKQAIAAGCLTP